MKIKELFFLSTLLLFSLLTYGQCANCSDPANTIIYNGNGNFTSSTAQAYYWEICEGNAVINGSNTTRNISVNCTATGNFKIKLTRFLNGHCVEACEEYTCRNGVIVVGGGGLSCPYARMGFTVEGRNGLCTGGLGILDMALLDENNVAHVNWTWRLGPHSGSIPNGAINQPIFFPIANWTNYYMVLSAQIVLIDGTVCPIQRGRFLLDCGSIGGPALRTNLEISTLLIHPNPTNNKFSIKTQKQSKIVEVLVRNFQGEMIKKINANFENEINLSDQKKGVYFITVKYDDGTSENEKLILE